MARRAKKHIRLICPHCGRHVTVQPPQGFQRSMPCGNCRIPISIEHINAAEDEAALKAAGGDAPVEESPEVG